MPQQSCIARRLFAAGCSIALVLSGGCQVPSGLKGFVKKFDNPVMIPPPRRVNGELDASAALKVARGESESGIQQVSGTDDVGAEDDTNLYNAKVLVRVNGAPVFASEVLGRYGEVLAKSRTQMSREDFATLRENIIRREIRGYVEQKLLVETMKADMKAEQLKALDGHLDKLFEKEVQKLKGELKVATRTELDRALNERGTSLQDVRNSFANQRMAIEYMAIKSEKPKPIERVDLIEYYKSHAADFTLTPSVKWQQIELSYEQSGGQAAAKEAIEKVQGRLKAGENFADLAKELSTGPTADEGGNWEWTKKGSIKNVEVEKHLFSLPLGKPSEPLVGPDSVQIVLVNDRHGEKLTPFEDVQQEIHQKLEMSRRPDPRKVLNNLLRKATIETEYEFADPHIEDVLSQADAKPASV